MLDKLSAAEKARVKNLIKHKLEKRAIFPALLPILGLMAAGAASGAAAGGVSRGAMGGNPIRGAIQGGMMGMFGGPIAGAAFGAGGQILGQSEAVQNTPILNMFVDEKINKGEGWNPFSSTASATAGQTQIPQAQTGTISQPQFTNFQARRMKFGG